MYHVNPATNNPNKCAKKSCELAHYPSKDEALASLVATPSPKEEVAPDLKLVKEEPVAKEEVREESVVNLAKDRVGLVAHHALKLSHGAKRVLRDAPQRVMGSALGVKKALLHR